MRVLLVDALSFALTVWAKGSALVWTFVPLDAQPMQTFDDLQLPFASAALLIRVLDAEDELAPFFRANARLKRAI